MAYIISIICIGTSYAIATLGLNLQWGYTGLFNIGVAGFFAVGAYTSAILTGPVWGGTQHFLNTTPWEIFILRVLD
ncbi:unnamed protein product [marine sediment metagenome]|uniref:Branched-chain amino acid ABC transporter permease n=1 Tax=marine sediment metagenome TaxID=412755 RepID=X1NHN9_9ZZZZ